MSPFSESCAAHMSTPVYSVHPGASLEDVRDRLLQYKITSMAVIDPDSSELLGVVTRSDLYRCATLRTVDGRAELFLPDDTVSSVMTRGSICVQGEQPISAAAEVMLAHCIHRVFVITDTGVEGVISCRDVMALVAKSDIATPLHELMTSPVLTVRADETLGAAMERLDEHGVTQLIALKGGWPRGYLSQDELLAARRVELDRPVSSLVNPSLVVCDMSEPAHACAQVAVREDARQIVAAKDERLAGVVSALDFCKLALR